MSDTEEERGPMAAAARTAVRQCLELDADESLAVVTDEKREAIGEELYLAGSEVTDDVSLVRYPVGDQHGEEPATGVAAAMAGCDAFLAPTSKSISHTRARKEACGGGARGATLPGITPEVFETGLAADYGAIAEECDRMLAKVADAETVRVTTDLGTDITFRPGSREWLADTGDIAEPGSFSNLPAGEVFVAPETADGRFVVDGTMDPHGLLDEGQTITFEVEDGQVTDIDDETMRGEFERAAETAGDAAYNLAELGIGTNTGVTELVGSVLLDEKAAGTVHIAVGDDSGIGGDTEAPIHQDGIIRNPTVEVDGEAIDLPEGV
ncbi:aminopeptidase [Haloglomus litoreum]|uniref:aminopeptidase n=1 Tax=Haloglomus litoreum TaxID=3034026 RepID=UPI0023E7C797|nr:aminopeptidase [Haloglomus sp. DT116]